VNSRKNGLVKMMDKMFEVYDKDDATAPTINGARLRNKNNLCAVVSCAKPLDEGSDEFVFGVLCSECSTKMNNQHKAMLEDITCDFDKMLLDGPGE